MKLTTTGALNSSFTYELLSDSSGGAFRIEGDKLVVDDHSRLDFETAPTVQLQIRSTDLNGNSFTETISVVAHAHSGLPVGGTPETTSCSPVAIGVAAKWSPPTARGPSASPT